MKRYRIQVTANTDFGWVTLYNDTFDGCALGTPFSPMPMGSEPPFLLTLRKLFPTVEWELNDGADEYNTEWCVYISPDVEYSNGINAYLQAVLIEC